MKTVYTILMLFGFLGNVFIAGAQKIERYNTFSYNVNEGLLQSTIRDIAIDINNFCWISFPNGIQKFDGKKFTIIPIQRGLPDDKHVGLFTCRNGDLLLSHSQGISKFEISNNRFIHVYVNPVAVRKPVTFIGEEDEIIYFYSETGTIVAIDNQTYKLIAETKTGLPVYSSQSEYRPIFSKNIINHKVAIKVNYKLFLWDLKENKLMAVSAAIPDMSIFLLQLKSENEVLYFSSKVNNALFHYDFTTNRSRSTFIHGKEDKVIYRCHILAFKNKVLVGFNNKLFETDSSISVLKTELVDFQNQPIAGVASIANIKEDNFGNLYIQTVNAGIKKVIGNNYPVKYYGSLEKQQNLILSLLPDKKNNRVLAGTAGSGLLVFDTLQRLTKHIKTLPGTNLAFSPNSIIKNSKGDYILFNVGEKQAWTLKKDLSAMIKLPIISDLPDNKKGTNYFGNILFQNSIEALTQSEGKLYKTNLITNSVLQHEISTSYIMGGLLHDKYILTHGDDELIFFDTATFAVIKKIPFKNTGNVRCFAHDKANKIYMGSNNGIYSIDDNGKTLQHLTKQNGLPDDCIYAMVFDDDNDLWCSTNKGIFRLNKDKSIFQLKREDGLQENEFNTNVVGKTADGELFFGGVNGISSFYPANIKSFDEKINLFFTSVKANNEEISSDTAVWNITEINLPHNQNSLSFDFIAMATNNPGQYVYQYQMDRIDQEWIQNNDMQTVRYFLPPGEYTFKIYASPFFSKEAKAMREIRITINPPYWKTWWFTTGLGLLFAAGVFFSIHQYDKNKYNKKLNNLENEYKIQIERQRISRDLHDSIGAYANAVLYKTELLEKEHNSADRTELMQDLKFASKDIITSLRETVWALKKDSYTGEDCFVRIRNFIHPLSRYYKNIQFKIEGEVPDGLNFHYTKALNLVRIIQEAVTNSIKHASAKNIYFRSSTENGHWKLVVSDDGTGFDYDTVKKLEAGNGIINMERRAAESGYIFNIESEPGHQTVISVIAFP